MHVVSFMLSKGALCRNLSSFLLQPLPMYSPSTICCILWPPRRARQAPSTRNRLCSGIPLESRPLFSVLHPASSSRIRPRCRLQQDMVGLPPRKCFPVFRCFYQSNFQRERISPLPQVTDMTEEAAAAEHTPWGPSMLCDDVVLLCVFDR